MNDTTPPRVNRQPDNAPVRRRTGRRHSREMLVFVHASVLLVGISWWFGGQSPGARDGLLVWGTLGMVLFFVNWGLQRDTPGADRRSPLHHLWPLMVFDLLVLISCVNPSTKIIIREGEQMFLHTTPKWSWLPSSARPDLSFRELWQFNAIVLSCYNVYLFITSRELLRRLLGVFALNAVVLAVFGSFQKLTGATGLFFGLVPSPQKYFFSSFVYHNHWGAFIILSLSVCIGLLFHAMRRSQHRNLWHSPAPLGALAILFIAATAPLSASRSSSLLVALLVGTAAVQFLLRLIRTRRDRHESAVLPVLGLVLAGIVAVGGALYLSRDVIAIRAKLTTEQIAQIRSDDTMNTRLTLYRDTWEMASRKPVFGWGLESYADTFRIFNSQRPVEAWFPERYYREAHSDWLQAIAEVGFLGTGLLGLLLLAPLRQIAWRHVESRLPWHLLAGCGIVLAYAWVEFPFANPAVMIAFFLCWYVATAYARLERDRPDRE